MKVEPRFGGGLNQLLHAAASLCWLSALSSIQPRWMPRNQLAGNTSNAIPSGFERKRGSGSFVIGPGRGLKLRAEVGSAAYQPFWSGAEARCHGVLGVRLAADWQPHFFTLTLKKSTYCAEWNTASQWRENCLFFLCAGFWQVSHPML